MFTWGAKLGEVLNRPLEATDPGRSSNYRVVNDPSESDRPVSYHLQLALLYENRSKRQCLISTCLLLSGLGAVVAWSLITYVKETGI